MFSCIDCVGLQNERKNMYNVFLENLNPWRQLQHVIGLIHIVWLTMNRKIYFWPLTSKMSKCSLSEKKVSEPKEFLLLLFWFLGVFFFAFKDFLLECHCILVTTQNQITNTLRVNIKKLSNLISSIYALYWEKIRHSYKII